MDMSLHPSLKSKWILLKVLSFTAVFLLLTALGAIGLMTWMVLRTNPSGIIAYLVPGLFVLLTGVTFWIMAAFRRWNASEKERLFRASRLLSLGSSKPYIISYPVLKGQRKGVAQLARLEAVGPSSTGKPEWMAMGSLNLKNPASEEEVLVTHDSNPFQPLMIVQGAKAVLIGEPVTPESWQEKMLSKKRLMLSAVLGASFLVAIVQTGVISWQRELVEKDLLLARSSMEWPTASGHILASQVRETTITRGKRSVRAHEARITYRYHVDGRDYEGRQVHFSYAAEENPEPARKLVELYPPGKPVQVHYSPHQPDLAVLEPGHAQPLEEKAQSLRRVMMLLMAAIPLIFLVMCSVMHFAMKRFIRKTMEMMRA